MANGYRVRVVSAMTDGTNIFLEVEISSPTQTYPIIRPMFKVGTSAATIQTYLQTIANNAPALASDIAVLVGQTVSGA
jgi:hypothetical protein